MYLYITLTRCSTKVGNLIYESRCDHHFIRFIYRCPVAVLCFDPPSPRKA